MNLISIEVDHELKEQLHFQNDSFPFQVYRDDLERFIGGEINCHWHNELEFAVIASGSVNFHIDENCFHLETGDGIFVNSNALHSVTPTQPNAVIYSVLLSPALIAADQLSPIYLKYLHPVITNECFPGIKLSAKKEQEKEIIDLLFQIYYIDTNKEGFELHYLQHIFQVWLRLFPQLQDHGGLEIRKNENGHIKDRVQNMLSYIRRNYANNISVDDIARAANTSRRECFRCFRLITSKTPNDYLNEYRLAQASKLLIETDKKITEISSSCGFSHSSYFGKLFREKCGLSPGQFRNARQI